MLSLTLEHSMSVSSPAVPGLTAGASFLVQTVSGIREGNEVQVVDEPDFNVYASDAAMSSSSHVNVFYNIISNIFCGFCKRSIRYIWNYTIKRN